MNLFTHSKSRYTKKTTVLAIYWIGYCVGNIIGPQTFRASDAPHYVPAEITILALFAVSIVDILVIYFYLRWRNTKKEAERAEPGYVKREGQEFMDLTDWENSETVYAL
jgi:ACS family allantoate permease-like MFS transporter